LGYNTHVHGNVTKKLSVQLLNKQKCHILIYQIRQQEGRTGPVWGGDTSEMERRWGKGVGG
jgi:hypothetical protein